MNLLNKLISNKWVQKLIKFMQKEDKLIGAVDLSFIDELYEKERKTKRGRKKVYSLSQIFTLCMDGFRNGRTAATGISRFAKDTLVILRHGLPGEISHDTISRFFIALQVIGKQLFKKLVKIAKKLGLFYTGLSQVFDGTDLPTKFKKDLDAKWNFDSTRKRFYFGYGVFVSVDPATHLPVAGFITDAKKVTNKECHNLFNDVMIVPPSVMTGDPEFDGIDLVETLLDKNIQLIAPYNPRNTNDPLPIKYRAELYGFEKEWMREEIRTRAEVEHAIGTLKEHFHLLDFHVKSKQKVGTHVLFVLCMRLLHGIATFKAGHSPRKVTKI